MMNWSRLWLLSKTSFANVLTSNKSNSKNIFAKYGLMASFILVSLINIVMFGYVGVSYAIRLLSFEQPDNTYIVVFMSLIHFLGIFVAVVMVQATLMNIRDRDFLKTLPVQPYEILISKALSGFLWVVAITLSSLVSFMVVLATHYNLGIGSVAAAAGVAVLISIPLYVIGIGIAMALRKIVDGRKHAKQIRTALQVIMVLALMFINGVSTIDSEIDLIIYNVLKWLMPSAYIAAFALIENALWAWLALMAFVVLAVLIANKFLVRPLLNFDIEGTKWKAETYRSQRMNNIKTPSVMKLLLRYNFKQLFVLPSYFITCCLGLIYTLIITVGLGIFVTFFLEEGVAGFFDGDAPEFILSVVLFALYAAGSTSAMTGISIAVEGKSFYHMKCAPLSARQIVAPKILVNVILNFSFLLVSWSAFYLMIFGVGLFYFIGVVALLIGSLRVSLLGMATGLVNPRVDLDTAKVTHSFVAISPVFINALITLGVFLVIKKVLLPAGFSYMAITVMVMIFELILSLLLSWYLLAVMDKKIDSIQAL